MRVSAVRGTVMYKTAPGIAPVPNRMLTLRRKEETAEAHRAANQTTHDSASFRLRRARSLDVRGGLLFEKLDLTRLPRHVAVIMDGNGRWAQQRHLPASRVTVPERPIGADRRSRRARA